ncbi:GIY-YIG nuclease family protein [Wolbachia endosymbiont of Folsomia candida]|uniref:GIY-YIG nuclease family protein n=1 Tax=Wolbachia endosymbiont of Folsomia candida TaxID=169402 RepID=UPI000B5EB5DB|nr:GIY-YIG nuclease family protein [Wolbachia endosymbiont of Folsomia candida]APR97808.1 GIY-YIG nuclease family protein [Wolbachia endosymbiont of Folsomia candida]
MKNYYVYITASEPNGTLYIGMTSNLIKQIWEHKSKIISSFTSKYNVCKLVYLEEFQDINLAVAKEKLLKGWQRKWKIDLVEQENQDWKDLYDEVIK